MILLCMSIGIDTARYSRVRGLWRKRSYSAGIKYARVIVMTSWLPQEKFGSEEVRLAPITPLPTILSKSFSVLFCPPGFFFRVTPDTFVMVLGTSTRCSVSYRFRGSHSLITPHLFPISYYARDRSRKVLEVIASRTPPPA